MRIQLVPRPGQPDFLDLPWDEPLEEWQSERLAVVERGISRHVVRFVEYDGTFYALKEINHELAHREYRLLRALAHDGDAGRRPDWRRGGSSSPDGESWRPS